MALVATTTDNGNGTVDVVVSGSSESYTVFSWGVTEASPTVEGTNSLDSSFTVSMPLGLRIVYAQHNTALDASPPKRVAVTNVSTSVQIAILSAVRDVVVGLALENVDSSRVVVYKVPVPDRLPKVAAAALGKPNLDDASPAVVISPVPETRNPREQYNGRLKTGYGVNVAMFRGSNRNPVDKLTTQLTWRERVTQAFQGKQLATVPGVMAIDVEPGVVFDFPAWEQQYDLQAVTLRCETCEVTL